MNLHIACGELDTLSVIQFLLAGESPNFMDLLGDSPLMYTIKNSYKNPEVAVRIVECLLYFGADPNLRLGKGCLTPLMLAVLASNRDIVLRLLGYNANVNALYIPEEEFLIPNFSTAISICLSLTNCTDIALDLFKQEHNQHLLISAISQAKIENITSLYSQFIEMGFTTNI